MLEYYQALERLKENNPKRVSAPYTINKDTVALEAGRKRGSIKKSRHVFRVLIEEIDKAAREHALSAATHPLKQLKDQLKEARSTSLKWRERYEEALGRELSLINQVHQLQLELTACRDGKPMQQKPRKSPG